MQDDYSWKGGEFSSSTYQSPKSDSVGKWVFIALIFALVLHAVMIWGLSRIDVMFPQSVDDTSLETEVVRVHRVELDDSRPEVSRPEPLVEQEPVDVVPPADELDMLESIAEVDIDIRPDIETLEVPMSQPALMGELDAETFEPMKAPVFDPELPAMGFTEDLFPRANAGQVIVDPGSRMAEEFDPDEYTDLLRKGAGGAAEDGLFKEFTSLDAMAHMDGNSLLASKALIGSDLLFDFNSAILRESARVSLMKVALLIDKNPELICWVDGHSDLIGGDEPNMILSQKRAAAVKTWLVNTLDLNENRVAVTGYGERKPLIKSGTADEQAANRRVEIKMRKGRPKNEPSKIAEPPRAIVVNRPAEPAPSEPEPAAVIIEENEPVLVRPTIPPPVALIVEEEPLALELDPPMAIEALDDELPEIDEPPVAIPVDE